MTESETRAARRAYDARNSDQKTTNEPLPTRTIVEEEVVLPDSELAAGATVTMQRHVHTWSVDNPDE